LFNNACDHEPLPDGRGRGGRAVLGTFAASKVPPPPQGKEKNYLVFSQGWWCDHPCTPHTPGRLVVRLYVAPRQIRGRRIFAKSQICAQMRLNRARPLRYFDCAQPDLPRILRSAPTIASPRLNGRTTRLRRGRANSPMHCLNANPLRQTSLPPNLNYQRRAPMQGAPGRCSITPATMNPSLGRGRGGYGFGTFAVKSTENM
jgi:hypothetical protein